MADEQAAAGEDRDDLDGSAEYQVTGNPTDGAGRGQADPGSRRADGTAAAIDDAATAAAEPLDTTPDGEDGTAGEGATAIPARPTYVSGWQRLSQTFLRPPGPSGPSAARANARPAAEQPDFTTMTDAEVRDRISRIDPTERKVGLAASALAAVFALVYTVPYMVSKIKVATTVKPSHKTCPAHLTYTAHAGAAATCNGVYAPSHYVLPLVVWLVFAAAILVTVRIGRRAPLAFAVVLTGLAFGTIILFIPFVVAGGWLLLRAWRTQRYGSPTAKAPLEGYVRPAPGSRRSPLSGRSAAAAKGAPSGGARNTTRRRRRDEPEAASPRSAPTASKRYTPKAAPKRKVPPKG